MSRVDDPSAFESARPRLLGLAYRILGSRADAEDAVQDVFLRWQAAAPSGIGNTDAWLTTVCTRRCLDMLKAAHRKRTEYVGAWLPEPIHTTASLEEDHHTELASSLSTAFLLMLERLTPKERAAYILHEIFDLAYPSVAEMLSMEEAACRKLVSRAKSNIDRTKVRYRTSAETQDRLLDAFSVAVTTGKPTDLAALLSEDIRLSADGGGRVTTILEPIEGREAVLSFLCKQLSDFWANYHWSIVDLNGGRGFLLTENGAATAAVTFAYDETGRLADIFIVRNPDKLAWLGKEMLH